MYNPFHDAGELGAKSCAGRGCACMPATSRQRQPLGNPDIDEEVVEVHRGSSKD